MRIALIGAACFGLVTTPLKTAGAQVLAERSTPGKSVMIRPGDRVRLRVWREPDLSGEFVVDESGIIVFPKVGRVDVQHVSSDSLKVLLVTRLAESLRDPSIEVTVLRRVSILGSVRSPGVYFVDPTTTVSDALAMAGGVNQDGKQDRFQLLRDGKRLQVELSGDLRLADSPLQPGDQLRVPQRSWLSRNAALVASGVTTIAVVIITSTARR